MSIDTQRADLDRKRDDEALQEAAVVILDAQAQLEHELAKVIADLGTPDRELNVMKAAETLTDAVARLVVAMVKNQDAL